ncbi:DNA-directed RNA polymerase I subunit RPA43 isoform X2 [Syngnathus scovelli]|uniref:DNA-directed RNA polymerase I subunit RPA43 isoform X2 n=2 Tax=Syngnathus scovelli TaxID=161590 RepID=UPI002110966B|nr:DNA-directed RNA polymerase I subunit RPA43 isoform X2 [Syngnathus scovelli]
MLKENTWFGFLLFIQAEWVEFGKFVVPQMELLEGSLIISCVLRANYTEVEPCPKRKLVLVDFPVFLSNMANSDHVEHDSKHVKMSGNIPETCVQDPADKVNLSARVDLANIPSFIPSFAAASELVSAPYSCLVMNIHRRHIVLPPMYLNKKKTALREELKAELLKFSPSLQGVPLAFDNIQLLSHHGDLYDDSGYIHMEIQANFIIFQPQAGQRLLGKVNKLGVSHVGCLVHGCFNASIPKPNLVSVDTWRDAGPKIGAELEFEVNALDADTAGVLLIRGRLNRTKVQELLAIAENPDLGITVDQDELESTEPATEPATEPSEESIVEDSNKKTKKKKKDKMKEVKEEVAASPSWQDDVHAALDLNGTEIDATGEKRKKKKKKDKIKEEEKEEVAASPSRQDDVHAALDLNGTEIDASGEKRKKKKKKDKIKEEKEDDELMLTPCQGDADTTLELNGTESYAYGEKKKKKKKEKRIKEEEEQVQLSSMEIHASDSSGYLSDKPNKKRKHEKESQVVASSSQDAEEPKPKKKKRKSDVA